VSTSQVSVTTGHHSPKRSSAEFTEVMSGWVDLPRHSPGARTTLWEEVEELASCDLDLGSSLPNCRQWTLRKAGDLVLGQV
jgi:hypothetical protein